MSESGRGFSGSPALCHPLFYVALAPDAPGRKLTGRLREAVGAGQLVGALLRHAEHLTDLGHSYKFHSSEATA